MRLSFLLRATLAVLLSLHALHAPCQGTVNRDSLLQLSQNAKDARQRADLILQVAQSYTLESAAKVRFYAAQALEISDSIDYQAGLVKSLSHLTWAARTSGDYAQALEYAAKCLQAAEVIKDIAGLAAAKYEMAAVHQAQKNYPEARKMFIAARPHFEAVRDTYGIGKSYNGVGESYRWQQKWDSALAYYGKAETYFRAINHKKGIILLRGNRGLVYSGRKQYNMAIDTLLSANRAALEANFFSVYLESKIEIARIRLEQNNFERAKTEATQALSMSDSLGLRSYTHDAAQVLYDLAMRTEDYEGALGHQRTIYETEAKLRSEEVTARLSSLDFELRMRDKEAEIEGLQKDQRIRSLWQSLLGLLLALAVIIFVLMAYAYRRNRRTTRLLAIQNEQLGELNREKDSLMHIVAHDLKSPLSKVKALAAMAQIAGPVTDKQKTALSMIEKVVTDGERLIQDLLDISLAESNNTNLKLEDGELVALSQEWMGQHRENASRKSIVLHFEAQQASIPVHTDLTYLARIFDNILSNAIKYTPANRNVFVKVWADTTHCHFSVRDEGPGISKEDQEKMFRKFQRLSARPTAGESSTGLGLSIIKTLLQRLNGDVRLDSTLGEGSTFTVTAPLRA